MFGLTIGTLRTMTRQLDDSAFKMLKRNVNLSF